MSKNLRGCTLFSFAFKFKMAIFGKNGLWAAGLSVAALWALYGTKLSGFKDQAAIVEFKAGRRQGGTTAAQQRAYQVSQQPASFKTEPAHMEKVGKLTYFR